MASSTLRYGSILVVVLAVLYQLVLKTIIFTLVGVGREVQPISDFPYQCRRIHDERLQACEDMWLSESTRQLFLACSDSLGRAQWMPNFNRLNVSGRSQRDAVIAMDIDKPQGESFEYRVLKHSSYRHGDDNLYLVGFTGRENHDPTSPSFNIELAFTNGRPHTDPKTGNILDAPELGDDPTIELFETDANAKEIRHKKTYAHAEIKTANNVAFASNGGFYISNDHGTAKSGWRHILAPILYNGDITYCDPAAGCKVVSTRHQFPNGLMTSRDRRHLYVPSAHGGDITVYRITPSFDLERIDSIPLPYPIDNLSQDQNGDIWAPVFPKGFEVIRMYDDPMNVVSPAAVFRIRKKADGGGGAGWEVEKIVEDRDSEVLPGATAVVHDAKTGRLFVSGVISPFIAVCEPRKK